jgi:hypothetical protein
MTGTRVRRGVGRPAVAALAAALLAFAWIAGTRTRAAVDTIPPQLTDQEFWSLTTGLSEPAGTFRSDNLLSNEIFFERALGPLVAMTRPGRAYLGVGPEQNFTYAVALRPSIAFIIDVRRGNFDLHLMYKALFELSRDRVDFVSRLFSRKRPNGVGSMASVSSLFEAFGAVGPTADAYTRNLAEIRNQLLTRHHFPLSEEDLAAIAAIYRDFYTAGPEIRYSPYGSAGGTIQPTYAELMAATDDTGQTRGFLANDATFATIKRLETRNLVVPVVGNFGGPKAIRAIGRYLKDRGAVVSAFYVSNVEEYLRQDALWTAFCRNVAALPLDGSSTLIRSLPIKEPHGPSDGFTTELKPILGEIRACQPSATGR